MRTLICLVLLFGFLNVQAQDSCEDALVISGVLSDEPFVCVEAQLAGANPNVESSACGQDTSSTVWFEFTTDLDAAQMHMSVLSADLPIPTIALFTGECGSLQEVDCSAGYIGEAILAALVAPNERYFISVSSRAILSGEGVFELCVKTSSPNYSTCVIQANQKIVYRSSEKPLDCALDPGEDVTLCFTVEQFTPVGNGCQWFQGIVPVFGDGWDMSEFDPFSAATLNESNYPAPGVYGGTWDWYQDVNYNASVPWIRLGPFGNNGSPGICNANFDPYCMGDTIQGGTVTGSCNVDGDTIPPGWFVTYPVDGCPTAGHPNDDWGDGNSCGNTMGPWSFCMDLKVDSNCTGPLKVTFHTFADGELGAWTGGISSCASDQPFSFIYPSSCDDDPCVVSSSKAVSPKELSVFPNPVRESGWITISIPQSHSDIQLSLIGVNGAVHSARQFQGVSTFAMQTDVPAGIYIVVVEADEELYIARLIVI